MKTSNSDPLRDALLRQSSRAMDKVVGWSAVLATVVLVAIDVFLVRLSFRAAMAPVRAPVIAGLGVLLALSLAITWFLASAGYRLLRARPNRAGSLAGPGVWFACFAFFILFTLVSVGVGVASRDWRFGQGVASGGLLALLSWGAAQNARRRNEPSSGAEDS